jgi:hypothetical protein
MTSWSEHPLCGPRDTMPSAFWGPEKLDSAAFVDLVAIYNREAEVAGLPPAHHGWLLAHAATQLEAAGFTVTLQRLAIPVRATASCCPRAERGPDRLGPRLVGRDRDEVTDR